MKVSDKAVDLNAYFEGFSPVAYLCPANVWTVGYGTTFIDGRPVNSKDTMTKDVAKSYMKKRLQKDFDDASRHIRTEILKQLTQGQIDAIAMFVYNIGIGNFQKKNFLPCLNAGDFEGAAQDMLSRDKSKGIVIKGLTRRRKAEVALFLGR